MKFWTVGNFLFSFTDKLLEVQTIIVQELRMFGQATAGSRIDIFTCDRSIFALHYFYKFVSVMEN